jgi:putative oxidoreductase
MALFSKRSSHPALSHTDSLAAGSVDFLLLAGRVLLGWLFLASGWGKLGNIAGATAYFTNLGMPSPDMMAWFAGTVEVVLGVCLILGFATRYAALATFIWVLVATAIAHRYWTYPAAAQLGQYNNFLKNISIMGGALCLFVTGAGSYSADARLSK